MLAGADGNPQANPIAYINTQLEYHLGIDPSKLSDREWAQKFAHLQHIREKEAKEH